MKTNDDSYKYIRLSHMAAIFFGLPITRRKLKEGFNPGGNIGNLAGIQ